MHLAIPVGALLWLGMLLAPTTFAAGRPPAVEPSVIWPALRTLRSEILNGTVVRAQIFYMPYHVVTVARVDPQVLERAADYKETVELSSDLRDTLAAAIDGTKLYRIRRGPDVRWGAVFLDKSDRPVHSIYLNGRRINGAGRRGHIDGEDVGLNGALVTWFELNFLKR
jgi:hypothetical protein